MKLKMPIHLPNPRPKSNPFGSSINIRSYSAGSGFRFGFNGKENINEYQDYGMRIYYPSLGKFLSTDPLIVYEKKYAELSSFQFASNRSIDVVDIDGLEYATFNIYVNSKNIVTDITVTTDYELINKNSKGPGVQYNYFLLDKAGKQKDKPKVEFVTNNVYGIYTGSKNPKLPEIGKDYRLLNDDYRLAPIDAVDALAKQHDIDYDVDKITGLTGVLSKASTPANEKFIAGMELINQQSALGSCDPITGREFTKEELKKGNWASKQFQRVESFKGKKLEEPARLNNFEPVKLNIIELEIDATK